MITYAAENPLALIVSSDLNLRSKAASTETISGGIWKWRKTKINKNFYFNQLYLFLMYPDSWPYFHKTFHRMGQHRHNQKKLQYNHTHNLVKKGTNTLLKSVFSEIRVRTWVQVVSRQKKQTFVWYTRNVSQSAACFLLAGKLLELMSWLWSQK